VAAEGVDVSFMVPQFPGQNGTLISATGENLGHNTVVKSDASGAASIDMKAYRPTLDTFASSSLWPNADSEFWGDDSWFTQLYADAELQTYGLDWAHPCTELERGYGFGYFHSGELSSEVEQTKEGRDKDIALANGTDSVTYTAVVTDPGFGTPVANWDVNFTTSWGYLNAPGTTMVPAITGADGKASVKAYSPTSGLAYVAVADRQLDREWVSVDFTDWMVRTKVLDSSMPAGDRATALIQATFVNIKDATKKIEWNDGWNPNGATMWFDGFFNGQDRSPNVFGYDTYDNKAVETNYTSVVDDVDTDNNGKYDAVNLTVPAEDVEADTYWGYPLESAGQRYALLEGDGGGRIYVGNIFYDEYNFVAAAERPIPEVNFVKTAALWAEGTMWSPTFSVKGTGFTPGMGAPDYTDLVSVYLGDFTSEDVGWLAPNGHVLEGHGELFQKYLGQAYVTKDGSLLPTALWNNNLQASLSPGQYNISVDGLVFKNGLTVKNNFGDAIVTVLYAPTYNDWGFYFVGKDKTYPLNVNAKGSESTEVYMTMDDTTNGPKLIATAGTTMFDLDMRRLRKAGYEGWQSAGGAWTATARTVWPGLDNPIAGLVDFPGYTTVTTAKIWVQSALQWAKPSFWSSKRTLKVGGTFQGRTEANGNPDVRLKVNVQRYSGGKWRSYSTKYIYGTPTSVSGTIMSASYYTSVKVSQAGKYRIVISHVDNGSAATPGFSHLTSSVTTKSRNIK
jgi:hypothetical protein